MSEYDDQAQDFITKTGTNIEKVYLGHNKHFQDDKYCRAQWQITLTRGSRSMTFKYGQSINESYTIRENGKVVGSSRLVIVDNALKSGVAHRAEGGLITVKLNQNEPSDYRIFSCIGYYTPDSFEDFCDELCYDIDSIKAKTTHEACLKEYKDLMSLYSDDEMELLNEVA